MPHVDAQGARLYVQETGQGYPIIFVHEFGADHREWETQVRYFSRAYRCITYNARGPRAARYGRSGGCASRLRLRLKVTSIRPK